MLKTNSKKAMENIKKEIIEAYEAAEEFYTENGEEPKTDYNEICADIMEKFYEEKLQFHPGYKAGKISKQDCFMDWMQGLPSAFPIADDIFLRSAIDLLGDILEETEEEKAKYSEDEAEKLACYLFYRELEKHARKAESEDK